MKLEDKAAPYCRETLARLAKILAKHEVLLWLNPVTNAISIKNFNFNRCYPFMEQSFKRPQE